MVPAEFFEPMSAWEFVFWIACFLGGLWVADWALAWALSILDKR